LDNQRAQLDRRTLHLPQLNLPAEPLRAMDIPIGAKLNFGELLSTRASHEAAHIKKASRPKDRKASDNDDEGAKPASPKSTTRAMEHDLLRRLHALLKETNTTSIGTNIARLNRIMDLPVTASHGNTVNAELNAGRLAAAVSHRFIIHHCI
jgi:hypothetical protein